MGLIVNIMLRRRFRGMGFSAILKYRNFYGLFRSFREFLMRFPKLDFL